MKPAHYKTLRESMGMTREWVALMLNVNPRSAAYWESVKTDRDVPARVEDFILKWWKIYKSEIKQAVAKAQKNTPAEPILLNRFVTESQCQSSLPEMTRSMHAALIGYILLALEEEGFSVEVDFTPLEEN